MDMYEAIFYDLPNGTEPALDFIKSLDVKMRAKLEKSIALLQQVGPELRLPYSEHLDDGIFEIRAKQGTNITRVLYFFFVGKKIILTNGFVKKTQKTPKKELDLAKKYRTEYKSRGEKKMTKFNDFLAEELKNPEFKAEYDALEPEFAIIQAMIDARRETGLTQKELSEKTGINQADISKLERGNANPSLKTLKRLAAGMGRTLKVEFARN